jgi:hypothetical protein
MAYPELESRSHKPWKKSQISTIELLKMEIVAHDQALGR